MAEHLIQVDEYAAAQEAVDLVLTSPLAAHQSLQGFCLIAGVVVDVQVWIALPLIHSEIDESLEGDLFLGAVVSPPRVVLRRSVGEVSDAE